MFKSLRTKLLLIMLLVVALSSLVSLFFSESAIHSAMVNSEETSARNVLKLASLAIELQYQSAAYFRDAILKDRKRELENIVSVMEAFVRNAYQRYKRGELTKEQAQKLILREIRSARYGNQDYLWIADYNSRLISHPDDRLVNADFSQVRDERDNLFVPAMVKLARDDGKGFYSYWWRRLGQQEPAEKLSYFVHFPEWNWVLVSGVYIDDVEREIQCRLDAALEELRVAFSKIKVAKSGYIFVFNDQKEILIHPALTGEMDDALMNHPISRKAIIEKLSQVAFSENKHLEYLWDKPNDEGNYKYPKVSYVEYYEPLGWYVCSSVYKDEISQPARDLRDKLLSSSFAFFGVAMALSLLFTKKLTDPLRRLTAAMISVRENGLAKEVVVPVDGYQETRQMGVIFNSMMENLRHADEVNSQLNQSLREHNQNLEAKVAERTQELSQKNSALNLSLRQVEEANQKITESIEYARDIQLALLPEERELNQALPERFTLWEQRDIVGGDIYVMEPVRDGFIVGVLDCAGHGVPGAFMTIIAVSCFRKAILEEGYRDPARVLKRMNTLVKTALRQDRASTPSDDGLDAALCLVQPQKNLLTFAGARIPLFIWKNGEVESVKADRMSLGYKRSDINFEFKNNVIHVEEDMRFYLSTDGYFDQLGGPRRHCFGKKRFINTLKTHAAEPFDTQKQALNSALKNYQGHNDRLDDVTVIGFRAPSSSNQNDDAGGVGTTWDQG